MALGTRNSKEWKASEILQTIIGRRVTQWEIGYDSTGVQRNGVVAETKIKHRFQKCKCF